LICRGLCREVDKTSTVLVFGKIIHQVIFNVCTFACSGSSNKQNRSSMLDTQIGHVGASGGINCRNNDVPNVDTLIAWDVLSSDEFNPIAPLASAITCEDVVVYRTAIRIGRVNFTN
jgi:hypothetical protein